MPPKTDEQDPCRQAFVVMIQEENFEADCLLSSLAQHKKGPAYGFKDPSTQQRFVYFSAGWNAYIQNPARQGVFPCRDAFVEVIQAENAQEKAMAQQKNRRLGKKISLKQHWSGKAGGFADETVQEHYRDFSKGYFAALEHARDFATTPTMEPSAAATAQDKDAHPQQPVVP